MLEHNAEAEPLPVAQSMMYKTIEQEVNGSIPGLSNFFTKIVCLGLLLYKRYFSYLMATVHKSMFPGLFLSSMVLNQSIKVPIAAN